MEQKKQVPKRRFDGFDEEWEERIFEDLLDTSEGIRRGPFGSMLKKATFVSESNYVVYEQYNAISDKYNTRYNITKEKYEELQAFKLKPGDFIMSGAGTIGRISRVPEGIKQGVFNQALIRIKTNPKRIDSEFFLQWMRSNNIQKKLTEANPASAMVNLVPMSEVKNWIVIVPSKDEQQKIGLFFKQLDEMISTQQREVEKTKALKSAYLAEMFPAVSERVPKRRFAGFTGEWEKFILMDIVEMFDNLRVPVTASNRIIGSIPYYGANGIQDYVEGYTHEGEFVLIAEDGANDLNNYPVHYVQGKIWVNNHAHVLSGKKSIVDNKFLASSIKSINISKWLVGGGRAKLNAEVLKKIEIKIPIYEEQKKIGNFFTQLDNKITYAEHKLEKLKAMKQAYLQEMFV